MFWRKKQSIDWPLLTFSIVIVIMLVTALLSVILGFIATRQAANVPGMQTAADTTDVPEVREAYVQAIQSFIETLKTDSLTKEDILAKTEELLFSVRVPGSMRTAHLNAFLQVDKLQREASSDQDTQSRVIELLSTLIYN